MYCSHPRPRAGMLALVSTLLAACSEPPSTAPESLEEPAEAADLDLLAPSLRPSDLVRVESVVLDPPDDQGALRAEGDDLPAQILRPRTKVGFLWDEAYAEGSHDYTGSASKIETTVSVDFEGAHVASYMAVRQEAEWLSTQVVKHLSVYAGVPVDKTCGLSVQGRSLHSAWWQFFQIKSAPTFGTVMATSRGGPVSQDRCGRQIANGDPTGGTRESSGMSCTYLITYDKNTLEIFNVELLGCTTSGVLM